MVNVSLLRDLVPLAALPPAERGELARAARAGNYQAGQVIFSRGESAKTVVWLLSGAVELVDERGTRRVEGGTPEALHPIAQGTRRAATGTALGPSQVLLMDRDRLDLALTWAQSGGVEVVDLAVDEEPPADDWMGAMLRGPAFERIPPAQIAQLFAAMKPHAFKAGELIVRQGDPGDAYYVITAGRVHVLLKDAQGRLQELAKLGVGQGFGEESLLSGNPRGATVRALADGSAMRLSVEDFNRFLRAPLLREIPVEDIPEDAVLVDVRVPEEFKRGRLPGAINLPLVRLRAEAARLDPKPVYVVYCDTGRRSASGTWLLCERGLDARLLAGGVPVDEMPVRG
jgi:CRP-like cAMP-binding protein